MTERIENIRDLAPGVNDMLDNHKIYLNYGEYAKFREKIIMA
jgi:hypothetical protein